MCTGQHCGQLYMTKVFPNTAYGYCNTSMRQEPELYNHSRCETRVCLEPRTFQCTVAILAQDPLWLKVQADPTIVPRC